MEVNSALRTAVSVIVFILVFMTPAQPASADNLPVKRIHKVTDPIAGARDSSAIIAGDTVPVIEAAPDFTQPILPADSIGVAEAFSDYEVWQPRDVEFNPDPGRAVWMSALFPGLGQVYNRRYWKIPIVIGAYMGLGYATSWNNGMLTDYTRGYRDLMDNDPNTNSYMNFFPPTTKESDIDKTWLSNLMKSRKDFYRRNRDLCIIAMVGVYLVAMVDAYVDASLSHFDISPDLSLDMTPVLMNNARDLRPALGLACSVTF